MTEFNPINMNPDRGLRINLNSQKESENQQTNQEPAAEENNTQLQQNFLPADQILDFMSKSAIPMNIQSSKIDISKYVNAEEKARITKNVNDYLQIMTDLEKSSMAEFNVPQVTAQSIALQVFNTQYMPA